MKTIFTLLLFVASLSLSAQNIPIAREVQQAYKNKTRSPNGMPGAKYWQNEIKYEIDASINPSTKMIHGKAKIYLTNRNLRRSLYSIKLKLYPNMYQANAPRDKPIDSRDINDGMKIHQIHIDGKSYNTSHRNGTTASYSLNNSVTRDSTCLIEVEWSFEMPKYSQIRVSAYDATTMFVGYWYPQVAVLSDLTGWDNLPYDALHEFNSEFADFDITLRVPKGNVVWATGELQNPSDVFQRKVLKKYKQAQSSDKVVHIITQNDIDKQAVTTSDTAWHFVAKNVLDFAFATSDYYLFDGQSVVVDSTSMRRSSVYTAYRPSDSYFPKMNQVSKETMQWLSFQMPGVPYPYPHMTIFSGSGGMEFPMMVNEDEGYSYASAVNVTTHEIAHTYFPFLTGIDQVRYSWMDEGWAMFLVAELQEQLAKRNEQRSSSRLSYEQFAGLLLDVPIMTPSFFIKNYEYYIVSYYKTELAYRQLENALGKDLFRKALQEYIRRWTGKHPMPYDFFFTIEDVAKQDLSWFWNPWFFEYGYPDLAIKPLSDKDSKTITILKKGNMPVQIELTYYYRDKTSETQSFPVTVWEKGNDSFVIILKKDKKPYKIVLGNKLIPDTNSKDNVLHF